MPRRHGKLRARAESRCRKVKLALTCAGSPPAALRLVASMYGAGAASVERSRRARATVSVTARYRALPSISYRVRATGSAAWRLRITGIPTPFAAGMVPTDRGTRRPGVDRSGRQFHVARVGELHRVGGEVEEHARQRPGVPYAPFGHGVDEA